jgi:predicted metal-binding protein
MSDREKLEALFDKHGYKDFRWIKPADITVSHWVRLKCMYGCRGYAQNASCPPNVPQVQECERFIREYSEAVVFHFAKKVDPPEARHKWSRKVNLKLLDLERDVFISGFHKAFLLFMDTCRLCDECSGKKGECKNPKKARPAPEAMAIDVFSTVRKCGYPIDVLSDYSQVMNRYAFLMVQ